VQAHSVTPRPHFRDEEGPRGTNVSPKRPQQMHGFHV